MDSLLERHKVILIGAREPIVLNLPESKTVKTGNVNHLLLHCPKWHGFKFDQVLICEGTVAPTGHEIREGILCNSIEDIPNYNVPTDYCELSPELSM